MCPIQWVFDVSPDAGWRFSAYYAQTYVPNHFTDGLYNHIGEGNYSNYVADYNTRHAVSAPSTVTVAAELLGDTTAYVKVHVALESALATSETIYIGLWEDELEVGGTYGNEKVRVVERAYASTALTISAPGETQDFEYTFPISSSWKHCKLGFTAWVQGPNADPEVHGAVSATFNTDAVAPASLGRVKAIFR